jgi:acyl-CoA synthetase (AMP-forming)/AMP-acid ligase II
MPVARFSPQQLLRDIEGGVTALQGVPAMYAKLLAHVRESGARLATHRLGFVSAGGSPLDPAIKRQAEALFGQPVHNGYGMTEASPSMTMTRIDDPRRDCSTGQPLPFVEIKIVDESGKELPIGETGHIRCRGPGVMKGYYRAPDLTARAISSDGWLITGDLGKLDKDGCLHIGGRSKELIIRSGFNVYQAEIEAVLNGHPKVVQAAVIGMPGRDGEEDIFAYVQVVPANPPMVDELMQLCAAQLAPYKRPSRFVLCESLPASPTGKIAKHRLADFTASPDAGSR